jgi:NitT/TauT family transport system ATP-binding protein
VINAGAVSAALNAPSPLDSHLRVCQNTLHAGQLAAPSNVITVPAAVLHIAQRQAEGWAYMRA